MSRYWARTSATGSASALPIPGGLEIDATSLGRILEITHDGTIGRKRAPDKVLVIMRSALEGCTLSELYVPASVSATGTRVDGSIEIIDTAFKADVAFDRCTVGGQVRMDTVAVGGYLSLDLASSARCG